MEGGQVDEILVSGYWITAFAEMWRVGGWYQWIYDYEIYCRA